MLITKVFLTGSFASEIDSLLNIAKYASGTEKVVLLNKITESYQDISANKSLHYNKLALQLAKNSGEDSLLSVAYNNLGRCYHLIGDYEKSAGNHDTALQYANKSYDIRGQISSLYNCGNSLYAQNRFSRAYEYYLNALNLSEESKDSYWEVQLQLAIANIYYASKDNANASIHYDIALELAEESGDQELLGMTYDKMGIYYYRTGRFIESIEYLKKAQYLFTLLKKNIPLSYTFSNLGDYYIYMKNHKLALSSLQKALASAAKAGYKKSGGTILTKIAHVYHLMGDHKKSYEYNIKALQARRDYGSISLESSSLMNIGSTFLSQNELDSAYYYLSQGIEKAREINHNFFIKNGYYKLYQYAIQKGDYEKALEFYQEHINTRDKVSSQERIKEITELKARYDIHDRDSEIRIQQLTLDQRQNQFIILLFSIILILFISAFIYYLYLNKKRSSELYIRLNEELENKVEERSKELKEKENQFQNLVEQIPMGAYRVTPKGKIEFVNQALFEMLGYDTAEELISVDLSTSDHQERHSREEFRRIIFRDGEVKNFESVWSKADGCKINVSEYARAVRDEKGEIAYFEGIVEDITHRKRSEKRLKSALDKAKESDKLKTAFLATMQHELRTPLNGILGFSELLIDSDSLDEESREQIQLIFNSGEHLLSIINDILDLSTITAGKVVLRTEECNINEIIDTVSERFSSQRLAENQDVKLHTSKQLESDDAIILTDRKRLAQILSYLTDNAFKFTNEGNITIGYSIQDENNVEFFVQDTGIGIPKDKQGIIFEQFRQVEETDSRKFGGSGLGLAICKNLINLMGGNIWVDSTPEEGSSFYFTLPYSNDSPRTTKVRKSKEKSFSKFNWKSRTILIAEDSYPNFLLLKAYLNATGINIIYAKNGEEAIKFLDGNGKIDLVLMDIQLPGISGYTATREIRSTNKDISIIAVTAYATEEDRDQCLAAGCNDYISKPLKKSILLDKISQYLS